MQEDYGKLYDANYYKMGCGRPYERNEEWLRSFDSIAERIVREIQPKTVFDAGCAMGFLVEGLRNHGVEAYGVDISEFAIQNVGPSIRQFCWIGSVVDPLPQKYDLITTVEVLEHMPKEDAEKAVDNFCQHTDQVLFSSGCQDYREITHFNLHPPEYWASLFARNGFYRDVDFDGTFLTPWTVLFRRSNEPAHRVIMDYERKIDQLIQENAALRQLNLEQRNLISHQTNVIENQTGLLTHLEGQYSALNTQLEAIQYNRLYQIARRLRSLFRR